MNGLLILLLQTEHFIRQLLQFFLGNFCSDAGSGSIICLAQMTEHIVAVRITIRRHTVANLVQLFYSLAFYDASQIPLQTQIHVSFFCPHCLI